MKFMRFDSLSDMFLQTEPLYDKFPENWIGYNPEFVGRRFFNFKEVGEAINTIWPEGMSNYERMLEELGEEELPKPKSIRRRAIWGEDGGEEVDLDRMRAGQPYWRTSIRDQLFGPKTVTIVTDISTAAKVPHNLILWRGAAAVCLTKILEEAGYRVELWAAEHTIKNFIDGDSWGSGLCLKRPEEPLDASTLINAVSGWCYRTLFFCSRNLTGFRSVDLLGLPFPISQIIPMITNDQQVTVCEGVWTRGRAVQWVKDQLAKMGCQ